MRKAFSKTKLLGINRFRKGGEAGEDPALEPRVLEQDLQPEAPPQVSSALGLTGHGDVPSIITEEDESALYDDSDGETVPSQDHSAVYSDDYTEDYSEDRTEDPSEYSDEYDEGTYEESQTGTYDDDDDELYDDEDDYQESQVDADEYDSQAGAYGYERESSYIPTVENGEDPDYPGTDDGASAYSDDTIPARDSGAYPAAQESAAVGDAAPAVAAGAAGGATAGAAAGFLGAPRILRNISQRNNTVDPYAAPNEQQQSRRGFFGRFQRLGKRRNNEQLQANSGTANILDSSVGAVADLQRQGSIARTNQLREDAERDLTESQAASTYTEDEKALAIATGSAPRSAVLGAPAPAIREVPLQRAQPAQAQSTATYSSTYDSQYSESVSDSHQRTSSISSQGADPYVAYTRTGGSYSAGRSATNYQENGSRSDPSEVLLHEGAQRRLPEIVDPYARRFPRENPIRPESIQPSLVETDSQSAQQQQSPLIPMSGPLSAQRSLNDNYITLPATRTAARAKQETRADPRVQQRSKLQEAAPIITPSRSSSPEFEDAPTIPLTTENLSTLEQNSQTPRTRRVIRHTPSASVATSDVYTAAQTDAGTFVSASPGSNASPGRTRRRAADISNAEREQLRRRKEGVPPVPPIPNVAQSDTDASGPTIRGDASPKRVSAYYSQSFHGLEHKSPHVAKSRHKRQNSQQQPKVPKNPKNYLLTPSVAPTETESEQGGEAVPEEKPVASGWLMDDMTPEQLHYFVRELVSKELSWELERAWLLTTFERPVRRSRDNGLPDDDSRANDFPDDEALDDDEDEDAVFRRDVYEPQPGVPDLPILRFLLKNAFCTFPLFVQPDRRSSKSNKPQPNKAAIARSFFFAALLPILRELQARSLSSTVDRHGESDGSPFSAMSMMHGVSSVLHKLAVRYVTAVLRVGPGNPYFGGAEEAHKRSWPWPSANLLPPEAYVSYRKPTDRLRQGGFEVDIVAVRIHSSTDRDFVLRIRRPNRTDEFVVRNDADWIEFAAKLAHELGPYVHVRPLPRLPGRELPESNDDDKTITSSYDTSETYSRANSGRPTRSTRTGTTGVDSRSYNSSYLTETTYDDDFSSSYLEEDYDSDEYSDESHDQDDEDADKYVKRARPLPKFEVDRRLLRSWLRDTLAIRSINDSHEVRAFLSIGSFGDRELSTDDLLNIAERRRVDCRRIEEREMDAEMAGENVLCIRRVQQRIWADCVDGDGFLKAFDALKSTPDFWDLPTSYQTMVSWGNLQLARFLYGIFVQGDESRANLARARDLYETVPWRRLAAALRLPALATVMEWQKQFLRNKFLQNLLKITFEDNPVVMDEELRRLQKEIGSDVMIKKLRAYVESPDDLKRLVRRHAQFADIPLVAAIVRGSDAPKLSKTEVQRVILATRSYNEFLKTRPNAARKKAHKEPGYMLITNLQRVLRLYSLHRDVTQIRGMLQDPTILDALAAFFEPLKEALARIHRVKNAHADLMHFSAYLGRLLDLMESLRARIQDPARSVNMIAAFLDRGAPHWYNFLHRLTQVDTVVFSAFAWLRHLAMTVGVGSEDLAQFWEPPVEAMQDADVEQATAELHAANLAEHNAAGGSEIPRNPGHSVHLDPTILAEARTLAEAARHKRTRQMEIGCRWSAGDTEGDFSIQVFGDGAGKIRQEPFLPKEPISAPPSTALDILLRSFRDAVSSALTK
ncbi:hypothetical protein MCUN1_002037 [Malassezia cuniculi]|uniref:PX domain-containing protein n=1 Tax=Malassezia cuniculi TaxID=948313 RepID=A0AAF0J661_9BASI|nr:hypothetical protein MCUN1_002037 [Malassezia cuniculi]